jgi:hypothetical protein
MLLSSPSSYVGCCGYLRVTIKSRPRRRTSPPVSSCRRTLTRSDFNCPAHNLQFGTPRPPRHAFCIIIDEPRAPLKEARHLLFFKNVELSVPIHLCFSTFSACRAAGVAAHVVTLCSSLATLHVRWREGKNDRKCKSRLLTAMLRLARDESLEWSGSGCPRGVSPDTGRSIRWVVISLCLLFR